MHSQRSSSTSSSVAKANAKVKAARAEVAFTEREADVMKQKAELEQLKQAC